MNSLSRAKVKRTKIPTKLIFISAVAAIIALSAYLYVLSSIPVNSDHPIFAASENISIKSVYSPINGHVFANQSSKGGKNVSMGGGQELHYQIAQGNLVTIHLINEIKNEPGMPSKVDINIDEFNVHSGELGYFQTKSITFLADKKGEFTFYSKYYPEMKGTIIIK